MIHHHRAGDRDDPPSRTRQAGAQLHHRDIEVGGERKATGPVIRRARNEDARRGSGVHVGDRGAGIRFATGTDRRRQGSTIGGGAEGQSRGADPAVVRSAAPWGAPGG